MIKTINDDMKDYIAHFNPKVTKKMEKFATDKVFIFSRYIFTHRKGKQQYGYCTHCKTEFKLFGLKHNEETECPNCKSHCIIKSSGIKRSSFVDEAYFVYYEKSKVNPNAIVARGIYAIRDYRFDYQNIETQFETMALYIFEPGKSTSIKRYAYYSYQYGMCRVGSWELCSSIYSHANQGHIGNIRSLYCRESIKSAVKGTNFQYSCWESYDYEDMIKFFDLYAKYPCIEYLTKFGMSNFVYSKLRGDSNYGALYWKGSNINKILRLDKKSINLLKSYKNEIHPLFLRLFQMSIKDGSNLTFNEIEKLRSYAFYYKDLLKLHKYAKLRKLSTYLDKQYEKDNNKHFYDKASILTIWKDYIADCNVLEMNLSDDRIFYPKDLHVEHIKTSARIKSHENELYDMKIKKRLESLSKYNFQHEGFLIRPAYSTKEMIDEGKALNICVGNYKNGYMENYALGRTNILFIRKVDEPNTPFYTMEIRKDSIIQVNGYCHDNPTAELKVFIDIFKTHLKSFDKKKITA